MISIEDVILDRDGRGISALRPYLPPDYCFQAANFTLENPGTVMIVTGFYILSANAPETDGPPGAVAIGNALNDIGYRVVYITDKHCMSVMKEIIEPGSEIVEFPIADKESSETFANEVLLNFKPSLLISIERCGATKHGTYLNMLGVDISEYTARTDYLFDGTLGSIGIGDGGNEIGMGNLSSVIPSLTKLPDNPCVTSVDKLLISSVSNWGGYGLVASLSLSIGKNLLPSVDEEQKLVKEVVIAGAVNGMSGKRENLVDGFSLEENSAILDRLHSLLIHNGIGSN